MKKADMVHRALAKLIDFLVMGFLSTIPSFVGVAAACTYILISDGFQGRSFGKRLIGLRVMVDRDGQHPCSFRDSMIRNLPYAVVIVLAGIPILNWILFPTVGLFIVAVEAYFVYADDKGIRLGDIFADTQVIDGNPTTPTT